MSKKKTPKRKKTPKPVGATRSNMTRFNMIANQMMNGLSPRNNIHPEDFEAFKDRYQDVITWVQQNLPSKISVGVLGAVAKAVLWFGKDAMEPFCRAMKHGDFKGHGDPAHVLYMWLMGRSRYNSKEAYRRTVAVIRAYCAGRQFIRVRDGEVVTADIEPAKTDIFDWDSSYTMMAMRHHKGKGEYRSVFGETPSAEEMRVAQESEALTPDS